MSIEDLYKLYCDCSYRVSTDSRAIPAGAIFFALRGENFDGNDYALKALEAGAAYAVVNSDWAAAAGMMPGEACGRAMPGQGSPCGTLPGPLPVADGLREPAATAPIAVLVNHHPSKIGKDSDERRRIAMDRLYALRDSLLAEGISRIVAVGDFNDEVVPAAGVQAAYPEGSGTIKFQGKWEKIDGCPVLEGLEAREHIFAPPHLSTRDSRFAGRKPLRTFSGPRYLGGLSDHYPIILELSPCPKPLETGTASPKNAHPCPKTDKTGTADKCNINNR